MYTKESWRNASIHHLISSAISAIVHDGDKVIAQVYGDTAEEAQANALKVAASPNLFAVCKSIRAALDCNYDSKTIEYELGKVLDDAIAKAEGER